VVAPAANKRQVSHDDTRNDPKGWTQVVADPRVVTSCGP
jgi:hypothetical protein